MVRGQSTRAGHQGESAPRKAKRPIVDDDYDDNYDQRTSPLPRTSLNRPPIKRFKTSDMDVDSESYVDVEGEDDTRFLPSIAVKNGASKGELARKKCAKRVVYSDDERDGEPEVADGPVYVSPAKVDDKDDDFVPSPPRKAAGKLAGVGKGKGTKGAKAKAPEKDIKMKDERKGVAATGGSKRPRPKETVSSPVDAVPPDANIPSTSTPKESFTSPPLKKRKLPPIKKNKPAPAGSASTPGTSTPTSSKLTQSIGTSGDGGISGSLNLTRVPAALVGNADFDLRKPNVYAELFKGTGGGSAGSGLARQKKEQERRKELDKMRDEAKAKRVEETKHFFDLQAQHNKVARFEDKLRGRRSNALYPNLLAGAFKVMDRVKDVPSMQKA